MTENTLRLLYGLLCQQQLSVAADRAEIDAVLAAREELEAELAKITTTA